MLADSQYVRAPQLRYIEPYLARRPTQYSFANARSAIRGLTRIRTSVRGATRAQLPVHHLARAKVPIHHSYVSYVPVDGTAKFS